MSRTWCDVDPSDIIEIPWEDDPFEDRFHHFAAAYEASDQFVTDAVHHLVDAAELPDDVIERACAIFRGGRRYNTVVEDAIAGEVCW
jgi:hypothetical protein